MKNFWNVLIVFLLFSQALFAQMTALDVAKIQTVTSAIMSDDGKFCYLYLKCTRRSTQRE